MYEVEVSWKGNSTASKNIHCWGDGSLRGYSEGSGVHTNEILRERPVEVSVWDTVRQPGMGQGQGRAGQGSQAVSQTESPAVRQADM